jgi:membrane dipeptidase
MLPRPGFVAPLLVTVAVGAFFGMSWGTAPEAIDRSLNRVTQRPAAVAASTRRLHQRLLVADLHADTLLWGRELHRRYTYGHIDLNRLAQGGFTLVTFAAATSMPAAKGGDRIRDLAAAQRWPKGTEASTFARALFFSRRLDETVRASAGRLVPIRSRQDLARLRAQSRDGQLQIGTLLSLEGAHALEGDVARLDALFDAGYRMVGLTHFFDNDMAGSAHGRRKGGLTPKGQELVARMERRGMIVDLAHASPRTFDDVLALAKRPVVVSHTGVRATCDTPRNLSDAQLRAVAHQGGLVGIGFWPQAVCGSDVAAVVRAIRHAVTITGSQHVALGSDFDGAASAPFDSAHIALLTQGLMRAGMAEEDIARIMGGNVLAFLARALPEPPDP